MAWQQVKSSIFLEKKKTLLSDFSSVGQIDVRMQVQRFLKDLLHDQTKKNTTMRCSTLIIAKNVEEMWCLIKCIVSKCKVKLNETC